MIGRVGVERLELVGILDCAELGDVERSVWRQLYPEHIVNADGRNDRVHQVRMLGEHRAHEKSAVASALDRQFFRTRVFLFDEILGRGREIIEHVLFPGKITGLVPFLAELAATANVCHHIDTAAIEPETPGEIEARLHADAIPAIGVEQGGILAVLFGPLPADDVQRNFGSIFGSRQLTGHFDVRKGNGRGADQSCFNRLRLSRHCVVPGGRLGIADISEKQRVVFQSHHLRDGRYFWDRHHDLVFAIQTKATDLRRPA